MKLKDFLEAYREQVKNEKTAEAARLTREKAAQEEKHKALREKTLARARETLGEALDELMSEPVVSEYDDFYNRVSIRTNVSDLLIVGYMNGVFNLASDGRYVELRSDVPQIWIGELIAGAIERENYRIEQVKEIAFQQEKDMALEAEVEAEQKRVWRPFTLWRIVHTARVEVDGEMETETQSVYSVRPHPVSTGYWMILDRGVEISALIPNVLRVEEVLVITPGSAPRGACRVEHKSGGWVYYPPEGAR